MNPRFVASSAPPGGSKRGKQEIAAVEAERVKKPSRVATREHRETFFLDLAGQLELVGMGMRLSSTPSALYKSLELYFSLLV